MGMVLEKRYDKKYGNVIYMSDGHTELAAALDYGIRVVHFACADAENILYQQGIDCADGVMTDKGWRLYGGHRFWAAPESELSYYPDNEPVAYTLLPDGVHLTQNIDPWTHLQKELTIRLLPDGVWQLEHKLTNRDNAPVCAAPWGITTLRGGGTATIPFPRTAAGEMNPRRVLSLWSGTSLTDPRLQFFKDELRVQHRADVSAYCKLGVFNRTGMASYTVGGQRFNLFFSPGTPEEHPDFGCNTEMFVGAYFLELESLGALRTLRPGESACHTERWGITKENK